MKRKTQGNATTTTPNPHCTGAWKKDWLFTEKVGLKSAFSQPSPPEKG